MRAVSDRNNRKHHRYVPEPNTVAWLSKNTRSKSFKPERVALVVSESHYGCGIVIPATYGLKEGDRVRLAIGSHEVQIAEVRWVKPVEFSLIAVGFEFSQR